MTGQSLPWGDTCPSCPPATETSQIGDNRPARAGSPIHLASPPAPHPTTFRRHDHEQPPPRPVRAPSASMKALADAAGLEFAPHHEPSVWLREAISDLRAGIMAASFKVCPHLRPGMVAITALWAPDRMVCTACLDTLTVAGEEDT